MTVLTERREVVEVADVHGRNWGQMAKEGIWRTWLPQMFHVVLKNTSPVRSATHCGFNGHTGGMSNKGVEKSPS